MSGHSHWAQIKRRKTDVDAQRANIYSKISRMIAAAAREGGPQQENNSKLRLAVEKAREANMPQDKIKRAIERGCASPAAETFEHILVDAFGPEGVPLLIEAISDNRNRTLQMVRTNLSRAGGKMGGEGTTRWLFKPTVIIEITIAGDREKMLLRCIEGGAGDIEETPFGARLFIDSHRSGAVLSFLNSQRNIQQRSLRHAYLPRQRVSLSPRGRRALKALIQKLLECAEIQDVYAAAASG